MTHREVPHADRDRSESPQRLGSAGLSGQGGYSGTPCPTKAALSVDPWAEIERLRAELAEVRKRSDERAENLVKVLDWADTWSWFTSSDEFSRALRYCSKTLRITLGAP